MVLARANIHTHTCATTKSYHPYMATNSAMFRSELPPSRLAALAFSIHAAAFLRYSPLLSPRITSSIPRATSALAASPPAAAGARARRPPHGLHVLGVHRLVRPLRQRHHRHAGDQRLRRRVPPQCVRKQPTAGWASTSSCGHHDTTIPLAAAAAAA